MCRTVFVDILLMVCLSVVLIGVFLVLKDNPSNKFLWAMMGLGVVTMVFVAAGFEKTLRGLSRR